MFFLLADRPYNLPGFAHRTTNQIGMAPYMQKCKSVKI